MANNSAEKKGACNQSGLGLGMEVHVYFWTSKLQRPRSMNLGQCFLQQTPGLGIPCLLLQIALDPASAVSQEPPPWATPTGCLVHRLPSWAGRRKHWQENRGWDQGSGYLLPSLSSPLPLVDGGLTAGVLIPGNLLMEPHLLSGSGNPTLLLTWRRAVYSTGGPSATSSRVLYSVWVSL